MRTLKVDEKKLVEAIELIVNENFLGISINELRRELKEYGFRVSPQVIRRNIIKLIKEKRISVRGGKLKHG